MINARIAHHVQHRQRRVGILIRDHSGGLATTYPALKMFEHHASGHAGEPILSGGLLNAIIQSSC